VVVEDVEVVDSGAASGGVIYLGPGRRIYTPPEVRRWVMRVDRGVTQGSRSVGHVGQIRMRCTAWADWRVKQGYCGSEHRTARTSGTQEM